MGFLKKIVKKAGRVVTSKSKTTKQILKVAAPVAGIAAGAFLVGPSALAIFGARAVGQNSEETTPEPGAETVSDTLRAYYQAGLAQGKQAGIAAGAGTVVTACQAVGVLLGGG